MATGDVDVLAFIGGSSAADAIIKAHPHPHRLKVAFSTLHMKSFGNVILYAGVPAVGGKEHGDRLAGCGHCDGGGANHYRIHQLQRPAVHGDQAHLPARIHRRILPDEVQGQYQQLEVRVALGERGGHHPPA